MLHRARAAHAAHTDASVISREQIQPVNVLTKRIAALGFIALSLVGTWVQFLGGWQDFSLGQFQWMFVWATGYQLVCSLFQFAHRQTPWSVWYLTALIASVGPSWLTYGALVAPWLAANLTQMGITPATWVLWVVVLGVVVMMDVAPEQILVRR